MSETSQDALRAEAADGRPADLLSVPEAAERLGIPASRVHQLIRDGQLLGLRQDGMVRVPADFFQDGAVVKGLPGTITVLRDAGFRDDEALRWLFAPDDSLPGTPVQALRENRGTEVKRRAQALAL